jgi:sialate O-acetylesterase
MVLQRNQPVAIWGFGAVQSSNLTVQLNTMSTKATVDGDKWSASFPAQTESDPANGFSVKLLDNFNTTIQVLDDVCFGDVFLFTGQSNIDIPVAYAHQFSEKDEAAEEAYADQMGSGGLLRIMNVPNQVGGLDYNSSHTSRELANVSECGPCSPPFSTGKYQYCQCNSMKWTRPTNTSVRGFSATAWFTGKAIRAAVPSLKSVAVGLVRSSWGGTIIQAWSSKEAVAACPQNKQRHTKPSSNLFNGMIAPFVGLHWSAVTWYQGESNTGADGPFVGPKYYSCALPALINDWRKKLALPGLPFFVVELSAYCNSDDQRTFKTWCDLKPKLTEPDYHLPSMRMAQSAAATIPGVYLTAAMDLGSLHPLQGSIHSARKVELGVRLALAAQVAVYGAHSTVWRGPRPVSASITTASSVVVQFEVDAGAGGIVVNTSAACPPQMAAFNSSAYCTGGGFEVQIGGVWSLANSIAAGANNSVVVTFDAGVGTNGNGTIGTAQRMRYAYADWPVVSVRNKAGLLPARLFDIEVRAGIE